MAVFQVGMKAGSFHCGYAYACSRGVLTGNRLQNAGCDLPADKHDPPNNSIKLADTILEREKDAMIFFHQTQVAIEFCCGLVPPIPNMLLC